MTGAAVIGVLGGVLAGTVLGLVHFGGLWLTLHHLAGARRPGPLVVASSLLRLAAVGAGLTLLASQGVVPVLSALVGLLLVRRAFVRRPEPRRVPALGGTEAPWS